MTGSSGTGDEWLDAWVTASVDKPWSTVMREWLAGDLYAGRADVMTEAIREYTMDWLAGQLAMAANAPVSAAKAALRKAMPLAERHVLDGGEVFILAVDQAAIVLGCDPWQVNLCPLSLNS